MIALKLDDVSFSYMDGLAVKGISLSISGGEMVGIVGPNGSGKTTILKLACGILRPAQGVVYLEGKDLRALRRREVAQKVAVVPQQFHIPFAFTVKEVVMLGRTPFLTRFSDIGSREKVLVSQALETLGIRRLEERCFNELSGGERQKAILAISLVQQPRLLLLDEPTAHLDISHQTEILELVRNLNREQGITVVAALHDLNLASLYFPRLVLLREGNIFAQGAPGEVLTPEIIQQVFGAAVRVEQHPQAMVPYIILLRDSSGSS